MTLCVRRQSAFLRGGFPGCRSALWAGVAGCPQTTVSHGLDSLTAPLITPTIE
jgi:hypothetical protein